MFGVQQDEPARHIIKSAEAKAESLGCAMNTAVVDAGGNLVAHVRCAPGPSQIQSVIGEADVLASAVELYFHWNSSYIDAELQLGGTILHVGDRPTSVLIVPPGGAVAGVVGI